MLQVIKGAGENLKQWIPELVQKMLVLLAGEEPEVVNYIIMNADKYNTTGEDVCAIPSFLREKKKKGLKGPLIPPCSSFKLRSTAYVSTQSDPRPS